MFFWIKRRQAEQTAEERMLSAGWGSRLALIAAVLVLGFLASSALSFWVSRGVVREGVTEQSLILTGDSIYSEIQKDILQPVFISSLMASDTFVRDWLLQGERGEDRISRYLNEIRTRYGTVSSFLVSDLSGVYYHADGVLKKVDAKEPRDDWYYRVRQMRESYEINVDFDQANRDAMTVFINYKIFDYSGRFLGVTGVGLTLESIGRLIDDYEQRFQRRIYFVDQKGQITLSGLKTASKGALKDLPGRAALAAALASPIDQPLRTQVSDAGHLLLVHARYLPELHWTLVVEQDMQSAEAPLHHAFRLNLLLSMVVTVMVVFITLTIIRRAQKGLHQLATTDSLTGLPNRRALQIVWAQWLREQSRMPQGISAILIDVDHFKGINDQHGHPVGDAVLKHIGDLLAQHVRGSDVVARWGGEEFLLALRDCPAELALQRAEALRQAVAEAHFGPMSLPITISLGVATLRAQEDDTAFFGRLDAALYQAKRSGRNRVEQAL